MQNSKKKPSGSGFYAPVQGHTFPKGTTFKKNKDGTMTPILPKKKSK